MCAHVCVCVCACVCVCVCVCACLSDSVLSACMHDVSYTPLAWPGQIMVGLFSALIS